MHIDRNNFLDEIRKGNTKALDYIMETYSPLVKGIVTKVLYTLGDNGLVEECIADVFISVWKNNISFTGDGLSFKKWIACISKYKAIDYYRKNKNNLEMYDIDECIEKSSYDLEEEIIDNDTVEVLQILNIANKKIPKRMDMKVYFKEMFGIAGNWEFKFKVSKEKIYKKTRNISINKYVELDNCKINVERIAISPISTTLIFKGHGEKKESILGLGFNIFDDRGKEIPTTTAGLSYDPEKNNKIEGVVNYNALSNKNIKNITIVPKYQNHNIKPNKSNPIDIKEKLPIILQQNEKNKLIIKDIEFKEDKIIVNYKAEGMSPINQSHRLYIYDENNKMLDEILEDRGKLLSNYYKTAIFTKVFKLNNSKKYYIGTDDMNDIKFYDKEKNIINIE